MDVANGKIIICGPGRSGTTLLLQILTGMGLDTQEERLRLYENVNAGLELRDPTDPRAPQVIKSPELTALLPEMLDDGRLVAADVNHVLVPLRDLEDAAASRVRASLAARSYRPPGGMRDTKRPHEQRWALAASVYGLFECLARHEIDFTVLAFPRFAQDRAYAFRSLSKFNVELTAEQFDEIWSSRVRPGLIHEQSATVWSPKHRLKLRAWHLEAKAKQHWKQAAARLRSQREPR
jgi:hypothetical protein